MWTRSNSPDGTFEVEVFDIEGSLIEKRGGFLNHADAERYAEQVQRKVLLGGDKGTDEFEAALYGKSNADLLEALGLN